jgi:hypothetical protein
MLALVHCTALSDFDVQECTLDSDCESLTGQISRCAQSRCTDGCANHEHCAHYDPSTPFCAHPGSECVSPVSGGGECNLSSGYDEASMGSLTGEDMLLVGAFAPSFRTSTWLALQLAADEVGSQGGLPTAATDSHPLWLFLCDDAVESMNGALEYLFNQVGVRALVASFEDRALTSALSTPGTVGEALFLDPDGTELNSSDQSATLLWALGGTPTSASAAYGPLIVEAVRSIRSTGVAGQDLKIASVVSSASEDDALASSVTTNLTLEGTALGDLMRQDRYRAFALSDDPAQRTEVFATLRRFTPHIVLWFAGGVFAGTSDERATALAALENDSQVQQSTWQPIYLIGPRNQESSVLRELATTHATFRARAVAVSVDPSPDSAIQASLLARLRTAFPEAQGTRAAYDRVGGVYDAVYYLTYALAAARHGPGKLTASDLREGLLRVTDPSSERVAVGPGPDGLAKAGALLASDLPFNTYGTTGAAAFDATQRRTAPAHMYCWDDGGNLLNVARYDETTSEITRLADGCANALFGP